MTPQTIRELLDWMKANCYNDDSYAIGGKTIYEGFGLEKSGEGYAWYYTERGSRDVQKQFATEAEAVAFAHRSISADTIANRHLVGFVKEQARVEELLAELHARQIRYEMDMIPYGGPNDPRTRVFVFGCDVLRVKDLVEKFGVLK